MRFTKKEWTIHKTEMTTYSEKIKHIQKVFVFT